MKHTPVEKKPLPSRRRLTLTVDDVAMALGRSRASVYEDLKHGRIPGRKLKGRFIIGEVAFMRWLNGGGPEERTAA